jgi:UrcA family protein
MSVFTVSIFQPERIDYTAVEQRRTDSRNSRRFQERFNDASRLCRATGRSCTRQLNLLITKREIVMKNLITFTAIALFAAGSAVQAQDIETPPTKTVHFADINLSSAQGAAKLYRRLELAAGMVCVQYPDSPDPSIRRAHDKCTHEAIERAVAKVDRPALNDYAALRGIAVLQTVAKSK